MSRPDLYDLACDNGGVALIPEDLCIAARTGRLLVWSVLAHRLMHADPTGIVAWGTPALAEHLGVHRRDVRNADDILLAAGLMEPVGKRSRAKAYRMLPRILDAITESHESGGEDDGDVAGDVAGYVAGYVAGEVAGDLAGYPATKGSEVKRREVFTPRTGNKIRSRYSAQPPPFITECPIHGLDNPFDGKPCGTCREARLNREVEEQIALDRARALAGPTTARGLAVVGNVFGDAYAVPS